jgi:phosphoglycerate kinase
VGPTTLSEFATKLEPAKTIFWNGTLGLYEKPPFDSATTQIAQLITDSKAWKAVGGGDTVAAIAGHLQDFDYISMGGGATLVYLSK